MKNFINNFLRLSLKNVKKTGNLTKKQVKICKKINGRKIKIDYDKDYFDKEVKRIISEGKRREKEAGERMATAITPAMYDIFLKEYGKDFMKANNFVKSELIK